MKRCLSLALGLAVLPACLDDWPDSDTKYPCRSPGDCEEGFFCHPTRFVCVEEGTPVPGDASAGDVPSRDGGELLRDASVTDDDGGGIAADH